MKSLPLALLFISSLGAAASPASERFEPINFRYNSRELATEVGRHALLDRMKATTRSACRGDGSAAYSSAQSCKADLEKQLLAAIGNPVLIAQYQGNPVEIARSGS